MQLAKIFVAVGLVCNSQNTTAPVKQGASKPTEARFEGLTRSYPVLGKLQATFSVGSSRLTVPCHEVIKVIGPLNEAKNVLEIRNAAGISTADEKERRPFLDAIVPAERKAADACRAARRGFVDFLLGR